MLLGALLSLAIAAPPAGGYLGLRLSLGDLPPPGQTAYPPPPPIVSLDQLNAAPPAVPAPTAGSSGAGAAFLESYAADFGLRTIFEAVGLFGLATASLELSPPCGGTPNPGLGLLFGAIAATAILGQPFVLSAVVGGIFSANGRSPGYWAMVGWDFFATLVAGPLLGLAAGELVSLLAGPQGGSAAAIVGLAVFDLAGAAGAPIGAVLSDTSGTTTPPPRSAAVPLLHVAFD